jgi:hypothetical protein
MKFFTFFFFPMKTLYLKNISKEPQAVRSSLSANKEPIAPNETREVEESLAKQYVRSYSSIYAIVEKKEEAKTPLVSAKK